MINKANKNVVRKTRAQRIRKNLSGTPERPRLSVFKSLDNIYAQVIDDVKGITIASASTLTKTVASKLEGKTKQEAAYLVGEAIAKAAIKKAFQNQIEGKGFSLVEVLSTCPTNWGLSPEKSIAWLEENMLPYYPLGVYKDKYAEEK